MAEVRLQFLGTGTSAGIPMIACDCAVCTSTDARDSRSRPSVVISTPGSTVLVDTSPELRMQAVAAKVKGIDAVVYTHAHADHIMGLDDVRRFNAVRNGPLDVWATRATHETLTQCFGYAFNEPDASTKLFRPHLVRRYIEGPFTIGDAVWTPIPLRHGAIEVLGFRVGNLAYCTDVNYIPTASRALLANLDVLVLDMLQHKKHTTHFSVEEALEEAAKINAKQTWFTHIAHALGHQQTNAELPPNRQLAYDGQIVTASL